ncbi:TPA: hypothetical protein ACX6Q7_002029 [Photobacterium damselae]
MTTISITYIGDKAIKRDTITGSSLVFYPNMAVEVDSAVALQLLQYPLVWVNSELAEQAQRQRLEAAISKQHQEQQQHEEKVAKLAQDSWVVNLDGEAVDLLKLNSIKLATLVEAHQLAVEKKGAQESVETYRGRIRQCVQDTNALPS